MPSPERSEAPHCGDSLDMKLVIANTGRSVHVLDRVVNVELAGWCDQPFIIDHLLELACLVVDDDDCTALILAVPDREPYFVATRVVLGVFNYLVKPNPDLKPESSFGLEAGLRWSGPVLCGSLAAYDNRYRDLIESRANLGIDPVTGALVFQSVNRDRARIRGIEADVRWTPDAASRDLLKGVYAEVRANWSHGTDTGRNEPLNSVAPARATLVGGWQDASERWGMQVSLTGVERVSRVDSSAGALYQPAGYSRWDANAWWNLNNHIRLDLRIGNLGNRRYREWVSLRGIKPDAPDLDLYTQPGRNITFKLSVDW